MSKARFCDICGEVMDTSRKQHLSAFLKPSIVMKVRQLVNGRSGEYTINRKKDLCQSCKEDIIDQVKRRSNDGS